MYSPVASTIKTFFTSVRDVADHGAGLVKRSSALHTMTQILVKKCQMRRIHMIHAVAQRKVSNKKTTVLEVIARIVESVGDAGNGLKCCQSV
jgi:hypothetical protein